MKFDNIIGKYKNIFWDFDGVIKESIDVKSIAFMKLFYEYDEKLRLRIMKHHLDNGGMSRYEKFPVYLKWADEKINKEKIDYLDKKFSSIVVRDVIDSEWVPGIYAFLNSNKYQQNFYLITATPQKEIEKIIRGLGMGSVFKEIVGSPKDKISAISEILKDNFLNRRSSVMIGDSMSDYKASIKNRISFILRRHNLNRDIFNKYNKCYIDNFL
jgi:phosphoglycolate phosphatase-like HAD superfamily hydrolase